MSDRFPFTAPEPDSMTVAEASEWIQESIPLISGLIAPDLTPFEQLQDAWNIKSRLRLLAGAALYDQELVAEFFQAFPLPRIDELRAMFQDAADEEPEQAALKFLLKVSESEARAFPSTVGEAIGMTIRNVNGKDYIMTKDGWQERQGSVKFFSPLLPLPAMVENVEIFHTSSIWRDPPRMENADPQAPAFLTSGATLWLAYVCEGGKMAVVRFDGFIEAQLSQIDVDTLKNHPYAVPELKPFEFNEVSKSLQTVYWAPLGARHWIISFPDRTLDLVARTAEVLATGIEKQSTAEALLPYVPAGGDPASA
jgi:hypothetical protein